VPYSQDARRQALLALLAVAACGPTRSADKTDSAFAEVQRRGQAVMGVDQYLSKHVFEDLPDGGRIVLDREDAADTAAIRTIRAHIREITAAFKRGDFKAPGLVHAQDVPGTRVMRQKRDEITYSSADRPQGAEVRMLASEPDVVAAIHAFLRFQRSDHRAAAH
jgi:hypothetical protein